jgi:hypothetical protein
MEIIVIWWMSRWMVIRGGNNFCVNYSTIISGSFVFFEVLKFLAVSKKF